MQLVSSLSLPVFLLIQVCACFPGANLTSNLDRIKIVFTPMRCRRLCSSGHCYNSCEKGDVTTVYSETSHQQQQQQQQPKNSGFRLCECRLQTHGIPLNLYLSCLFDILFFFIFKFLSHCLSCLHSDSHTLNLCFHPTFPFLFLLGEPDKMGFQWHAVCSECQAQRGGRVVDLKAESYTKNPRCHRERETGVDQIKRRAL